VRPSRGAEGAEEESADGAKSVVESGNVCLRVVLGAVRGDLLEDAEGRHAEVSSAVSQPNAETVREAWRAVGMPPPPFLFLSAFSAFSAPLRPLR